MSWETVIANTIYIAAAFVILWSVFNLLSLRVRFKPLEVCLKAIKEEYQNYISILDREQNKKERVLQMVKHRKEQAQVLEEEEEIHNLKW